jgi:hypothetical protein
MTIEDVRGAAWKAYQENGGRGSYFGLSFESFGQKAIPLNAFPSFEFSELKVGESSGGGVSLFTDCQLIFDKWRGVKTFINGIAGLVLGDGYYYRPSVSNFPCLDSLARTKWKVIDLEGNELGRFEGMIAFQFTIDKRHDVATAKRPAAQFAAFLEKKKESEGVPWFVFVLANKQQFRWFDALIADMSQEMLDKVRIFTMILPLNVPLGLPRTCEIAMTDEPVAIQEVEHNARTLVAQEYSPDERNADIQ